MDAARDPIAASTDSVTLEEARERLARSEERLALALEAAEMVGIWDGDLRAGLVYGDANFARIYGFDPAETARGKPLGQYVKNIHPDDIAEARAAMHRLYAGAPYYTHEQRIIRPDGTMCWVLARGRAIRDADGTPIRFLGASVDITERKRAEAELAASEARFRAAVDAVHGVIWTNNAAGEMAGEQPGWAALTGQRREQYQGFGWADAVHPDDAGPSIDAWNAAVRERRQFVFEHRVRRHDGAWRIFAIRAVPIIHADGSIREWVGVHTDVTEQRDAERRLRELNEVLEQRVEARTRERDRLWELSEDLLVLANYDGQLLRVSPSWTRALGHAEATLLSRPGFDLTHPDDVAEVRSILLAMRSGGRPVAYENRVLAADGSWRWIAWKLSPEPGGERVSGIGRDITVEKARQAELEAAQDALRQSQKMEAVGQLTGGIAHDFNNLLMAISGSLQMMETRMAQGRLDDLPRYVAAAQGAARRAAALTQRLLAFSRRQTLDPRPIDVNKLVAGLEELICRTVGPQIGVEMIGALGLWDTLADPNQLESALLNLCINARDAMPDGGRLAIETANASLDEREALARDMAPGDYVAIAVTDTGTGMPPEVVARAFDPFFTTKPLGQGTGLGLSMIYGFARQSGGQARIDSTIGSGTTVCLFLPRHVAAPGEPSGLVHTPVAAPASAGFAAARAVPGETVLVIDDEPTLRMLMIEVLEELGYSTIQAADGAAGLQVLRSNARVDLLITDIGLPGGINGRQLAEAGRAARPGLKVLFVTGYAEGGDGMVAAGASLITKPFTIETLTSGIRLVLRGG